MFIHRQTLSKQIRVVVLSYIPLPVSLGIGNIKTAAPTSKGTLSWYCWYRNAFGQESESDAFDM